MATGSNVNEKQIRKSKTEHVVVRFQWMHYNNSKYPSKQGYRQVYQSDGGGMRNIKMDRSVGFNEIFQKAKDIFFPEGHSSKGKLEDMDINLSDSTSQNMTSFTDLNGTKCSYKHHLSCRGLFPSRSSVVLMTKKKCSVSDLTSKQISCQEQENKYDNINEMNVAPSSKRMKRTNSTSISEDADYKQYEAEHENITDICVRYIRHRQSIYWDSLSLMTVTGRKQAKEFLQQSSDGSSDDDPLDDEFIVKYIRKVEKVYLDAEVTSTLKETVEVMETHAEKSTDDHALKYIFPSASGSDFILHGPREIFGYDNDELIIGVVCKFHGSSSLIYRWYKNGDLVKSGSNNCLFAVTEAGTYHCQVQMGDRINETEKIAIRNKTNEHRPVTITAEVDQTPKVSLLSVPSIPIVPVTDIQYNKTDEIGTGAFARVYKGLWIGSSVAIKVVELKKRTQSKVKAMVEEEVGINSKIRHPNIVQLMAVAYEATSVYLISEFVNGFNMEDVIFDANIRNRVKLTWSDKINISIQCLQAISYLHGMDNPIIHRDIKPANILIDEKSHVTKLCDLGVSRIKRYVSFSVTNLGGQPGTPAYMAPEVILLGKSGTQKSDIWSLGISLIELFAGEEAYENVDTPDDVKMTLKRKTLPSAIDKVDKTIKDILIACINFEANSRPDALQVLSTMKTFL